MALHSTSGRWLRWVRLVVGAVIGPLVALLLLVPTAALLGADLGVRMDEAAPALQGPVWARGLVVLIATSVGLAATVFVAGSAFRSSSIGFGLIWLAFLSDETMDVLSLRWAYAIGTVILVAGLLILARRRPFRRDLPAESSGAGG
jgi:hypothetical protein